MTNCFWTGLSVCGAVIIVVAFFSVKPLEFCGLKDPIQTLFGTRYIHVYIHRHFSIWWYSIEIYYPFRACLPHCPYCGHGNRIKCL